MKINLNPEFEQCDGKVVRCKLTAVVQYFANDNLGIIVTATGTARCHDDDVFDFEIGKRIAESRASVKIYDKLQRSMYRLLDLLECRETELAMNLTKLDRIIKSESIHLNKLTIE